VFGFQVTGVQAGAGAVWPGDEHMTTQKKLKKAIRTRAQKTGESYSAARRQVLQARRKRSAPRAVAPPFPPSRAAGKPVSVTKGAVSDATVVKKTGHDLAHWFAVLDKLASAKGHTDRARFLYEEHGVPGWHAQGITVAYERARGLRVPYQSCDGDFQVTVSKAVGATAAQVVAVLSDTRRRAAWLSGADGELARALEAAFKGPKPRAFKVRDAMNAHLRYPWDGTTVEIRVTGKVKGSTTVAVGNMKLTDTEMVEDRRARWRAALNALKQHLG
jgi:hypothetical protein